MTWSYLSQALGDTAPHPTLASAARPPSAGLCPRAPALSRPYRGGAHSPLVPTHMHPSSHWPRRRSVLAAQALKPRVAGPCAAPRPRAVNEVF